MNMFNVVFVLLCFFFANVNHNINIGIIWPLTCKCLSLLQSLNGTEW